MDSMFGFIALLIELIVLFTIGSTAGTAVVERTAEIGTPANAMGLRRSGIRRLFLCEALQLQVDRGRLRGGDSPHGVAYALPDQP